MPKFKVAQSGATADGRTIKPEWLTQIAETYDVAKYSARLWIEHLRGVMPDSLFRACGDVTAVEAKTESDGTVSLYAELELNEFGKSLIQTDQKIFSSIEVQENFAESGKAYLLGLGLTDSPASLGTEAIKFNTRASLQGVAGFHKTQPFEFTFKTETKDEAAGLFARLAQIFKTPEPTKPTKPPAETKSSETTNTHGFDASSLVQELGTILQNEFKSRDERITALEAELKAYKAQSQEDMSHTHSARPPSTGGEIEARAKSEG